MSGWVCDAMMWVVFQAPVVPPIGADMGGLRVRLSILVAMISGTRSPSNGLMMPLYGESHTRRDLWW